MPVVDGVTIRLATSGAKIQIRLESSYSIAGSENSSIEEALLKATS